MNKTFVIGFLIISLSSNLLVAQQLEIVKMHDILLMRFPTAQLDEKTLYVLNGVPLEDNAVDSAISVFKQSDLCGIQYLNASMIKENTWLRPDASIVVITTKDRFDKKIQKKEFIRVSELYHTDKKKEDLPALRINNELIEPDQSREVIDNLKRKKTECINIINHPVSTNFFGDNGKNGLVELQIKKRKPVPNNGEHP
jgi:hypothetical protein